MTYDSTYDARFVEYDEYDLYGDDDPLLMRCFKCGDVVEGAGSVETPCRVGACTELRCANCGDMWGGWGQINCECQRRDPKLRRIRQQYRERKS